MAGYYTYNGGLIGTGQKYEVAGVHDLRRNLLTPPGALYTFTTHTFTTAGNDTSRDGPTLSEAQSYYSGETWTSITTYFNVYSGVQLWKVPVTADYDITAAGARGGGGISGYTYSSYGSGRIVSGRVSLIGGEVIAIIVGAIGNERGGGGGSFVWYWGGDILSSPGNQDLIIAAGGGGGGGGYPTAGSYADAPQSESAVSWFALTPSSSASYNSPPTNGGSGEQRDNTTNYYDACPGAGWNQDGVVQQGGNTPTAYYTTWGETSGTYVSTIMGALSPKSSVSPGRGGIAWYNSAGGNPDGAGAGGFGGGGTMGGDAGNQYGTGGGGGGYSGGCQGGNQANSSAGGRAQGGGAGSYLTSSPYLTNKTWGSTNNGVGYVTITKV